MHEIKGLVYDDDFYAGNELYDTISDILKDEQFDIIRKFYAELLERCIEIWNDIEFKNIYSTDKINKVVHKEIIYRVLKNLKHADINNFREIYNAIKECEYILERYKVPSVLSDRYVLNGIDVNHVLINNILSFMINSFNVYSAEDIYHNVCKIKSPLYLNNDALHKILKNLIGRTEDGS